MPVQKFANLSLLKNKMFLLKHIEAPHLIENWAAVHLIFHRLNEASPLSLAMIRRVKNEKDPWSGHYAFPGGGVDKGEAFKDAALRETFEEIGLKVREEDYLDEFYQIQVQFNSTPSKLGISAHVSLITSPELPLLSPCPKEVDEAFWFSLDTLLAEDSILYKDFHFGGKSKDLPCIEFDGHLVWGLSYMIFREFLMQWENFGSTPFTTVIENHLPKYPYGKK